MSDKNFMAYGDAETVLTGYANRIKLSPTEFVGARDEWNALSAADKAKYTLVNLTDDGETGAEDTYTTTEQNTGKKWIDGKPIYRKVISLSSSQLAVGSNKVQHGVSNVAIMTCVGGYFKIAGTGYCYGLYRTWSDMPAYFIGVADMNREGTSFSIQVGTAYTGNNALTEGAVILEYTKTTD